MRRTRCYEHTYTSNAYTGRPDEGPEATSRKQDAMEKAIAAAKRTAEEQRLAREMVAKRNAARRATQLEEKEKRTQMRTAGK